MTPVIQFQNPYNKHGLEEIVRARTAYYRVYKDRSRLGFLYHRLFTKGKGNLNSLQQVGSPPIVSWGVIVQRTDLPKGTVCFCPDMGQFGSYWRYVGISLNVPLGWQQDTAFIVKDYKGSLGSPIATFTALQNGFKDFGRPATLPPFFWTRGCELAIEAHIIRTSGTQTQQASAVQVNGVTVFSAPWAVPTMREMRLDLRLWVNGFDPAADPNILTSTGNIAPGGYVTGTTPATADYPIAGLSTLQTTIAIGLTDTADGNPGAYALGKFTVKKVA